MGGDTMRKLIATAVLALLLALVGCSQGQASRSVSTSSADAVSEPTSSQAEKSSSVSAGQSEAATDQSSTGGADALAAGGHADASSADDVEGADTFVIYVGDRPLAVTPAGTEAARALAERLQDGPVTLNLHAYGGFEKVGALPWPLPTEDEQIITSPGDVMLYQGDQISIFTDSNSWAYTPLGRIEGATSESLLEMLGDGDVDVVLSLE